MRFLTFFMAAPALAYSVASGISATDQPMCSLYTVYYNDVVDLASATSAFFASMSTCTATSSIASSSATSSSAAASTSSAAPAAPVDPCVYSTDPTVLANAGFECTDLNNFGWTRLGGNSSKRPITIPSTGALPAHGGTSFLRIKADSTLSVSSGIEGTIGNTVAGTVTVTLFLQAVSGFDNTGCTFSIVDDYFHAGVTAPKGYFFDANTASGSLPVIGSWTSYTASTAVLTPAFVGIKLQNCQHGAALYVDDVSYTFA